MPIVDYALFFRSMSVTPSSVPKSLSTSFTLSIRSVFLPCSKSRTNLSPTPDLADKSSCVRLYFLRIALTYCESLLNSFIMFLFFLTANIRINFCILYPLGCKLS